MNFLLVFLPVLINCNRYKITHSDYDCIKELIHKPHKIGLYDEIINNPKFSCLFEIKKGNGYNKGISIIALDNIDSKAGNNIFPTIFCEISNIKYLILIKLKLSRLPNQFEKLKELEFLNLGTNKFKEFPQVLFSLSKLRVLYLYNNGFDIIPSGIIKMNNLEILNIQNCYNLINISLNLVKLKNLKELNLSQNFLLFKNNDFLVCPIYSDDKISTEKENNDFANFVFSESLKILCINNNGLDSFPRNFLGFINLEQLDISSNLFEAIPHELDSFAKLKILNISFNHIEKVIIENGMFNNLLGLYLYNNRISELSISDNALQILETLNLSNNNFSKLDRNIFQLKRLKNISVFGNIFIEIEKFPCTRDESINFTLTLKDISVLPNIFCYNGIDALIICCINRFDGEVGIFEHVPTNSKIKYLSLFMCFLTSIPRDISKLINLETFNAGGNEIIILENVFTGMTSLKSSCLSFNQITNIDRSIFDIATLENLELVSNRIELLPYNINNTRNRNLQIDLRMNPLHSWIYRNIQNPELISIEQVNQNILRNIIYDRIRIFRIPEDINFELNVKKFYEELDIPIDEKLNFEKIKLCKTDKPQKHTKTRQEIEKMLQNIFKYITYKREEKLTFLMRRIETYYYYEDNLELIQDSYNDYQKRNSIIDHLESIVIIMTEMLPEKQEDVEEALVRLLGQLNFNYNATTDKVYCLDGQEEAFIATYLFLKRGNDCSSAEEKIIEILTNLKFEILKGITTGRGEKEEVEVFLNWRNILSEELGFEKVTNLYGNQSRIPELHDKEYIVKKFFSKFTCKTIIEEINKHLKERKFGLTLFNQLREYLTNKFGEEFEINNIFEYFSDENYFQINDKGAHILLKSMGYLYEEENNKVINNDRIEQGGFEKICAIL